MQWFSNILNPYSQQFKQLKHLCFLLCIKYWSMRFANHKKKKNHCIRFLCSIPAIFKLGLYLLYVLRAVLILLFWALLAPPLTGLIPSHAVGVYRNKQPGSASPPTPLSQDLIASSRRQWPVAINLPSEERCAALENSVGSRLGSGKYKGEWRGSSGTEVFLP